ncbi:hypothetical protein OnM2_057021 [Erysiphe neolycopersici]|uniref:TM7S3/TM198-like domain-containing protein n=1 Tax=Erysiphe neolycopersici TaxID=212602 RepID=A0A420HQQ0_9PEZI|nr:hypothetical protein OnM2_057021 [Erysiphe neolycopersici]
MVFRSPYKMIAFQLVCLFVQLVSTDPLRRQLYRRLDTPSSTIASPLDALDAETAIFTPSIAGSTDRDETSYASSKIDPNAISTSSPSPSAVNSAMNGISTSSANLNSSGNSYNELTSTDLPIKPRITPGFAVAGIILIISGIVYGTTGIKNRWLHIYISSAYLAAIATTVLILYVINLPISDATQGAYVVAIIAAGAIFGAASILFSDLTEGLCCLLGGFTLSMWLLVLHPNGLLSGNSMIALITVITIGSFAASYSKYTRSYCHIFFISFGGATSIILGIDCFSRAGLKEFWAYLWALNPNLFPLEETSCPLTRGIRVETASILVISLAGIISQFKLWKIVQERRKKKLDEGLQVSRKIEEEEDNIGKKIIQETAKEKDQWEVVFRNEDKNHPLSTKSSRATNSMIQPTESSKTAVAPSLPIYTDKEFSSVHKGLEATNRGTIIVRVAQDIDKNKDHVSEITEYANPDTEEKAPQPDDQARLENQSLDSSSISSKKVPTSAVSPAPIVISLPFKIPESPNSLDSNRSSIGTKATIGDETLDDKIELSEHQLMMSNSRPKASRNSSTAPRPINLFGNCDSELGAKASVDPNVEGDKHLSYDVYMPRKLSIASAEATQNSLSPSSLESETPISKEVSELEIKEQHNIDESKNQLNLKATVEEPMSPRSSVSKTTEEERVEDPSSPKSSPPSITDSKLEINSQIPKNFPQNHHKSSSSISSSTNLQIKKITKDNLPSHVSKVFMSYRTNEWAKHLEYAEKPEIEDLEKYDLSSHSEFENVEKPVPVRIQELQQTSEIQHPPTLHSPSNKFYRQSGIATSESNLYSDSNNQSKEKIITNNSQGSLVSQHSLVPSYRVNRLSMAPSAHNNLRFEHSTDSRSTLIESSKGCNGLPQAHLNGARVRNSTLINQRSSIARNKGLYKRSSGVSILDPNSAVISQAGSSETGSTYNCPLLLENDETMSLSQRRDLIRQASIAAAANPNQSSHSMIYNTNQLRRMSTLPSSQTRQQKLAWWRASVRQDLQASLPPEDRIEQQRNKLRESQKLDELRRLAEERKKDAREEAWDDMMRSGEMLDAHREALRRLQHKANQKIS